MDVARNERRKVLNSSSPGGRSHFGSVFAYLHQVVAPTLVVTLLSLTCVVALHTQPASAAVLQIQPADENEDPEFSFNDSQAIYARTNATPPGGVVCIISADGPTPSSCSPVMGKIRPVPAGGGIVSPVKEPPLKPCPGNPILGYEECYRLMGDLTRSAGDEVVSAPFSVHPCLLTECLDYDPDAFKTALGFSIAAAATGYGLFKSLMGLADIAHALCGPEGGMAKRAVWSRGSAVSTHFELQSINACIVGGVVGSFVVAAAWPLATTDPDPLSLLKEVVEDHMLDLIKGAGEKLGTDPPDLNYTQVAEPEFLEVPSVDDPSLDEIAATMERIRAIAEAIQTARDRMAGAEGDGAQEFVVLQVDAISRFATMLRDEYRELSVLEGQRADALAADPVNLDPILTTEQATLMTAQLERLKDLGFNSDETAQMVALGYSVEDIEQARQDLVDDLDAISSATTTSRVDATRAFAAASADTADLADDLASATAAIAARLDANQPPVPTDDYLVVDVGSSASVNVLANDTDPDGDPLSVADWTDGANGTVSCESNGDCTYTPASGFTGGDSFTYTVGDGNGGTATGTVTVTVNAPGNQDPVPVNENLATTQDIPGSLNVLANDTDPDGDPLSVADWTDGANGTVSCESNGDCTYTPASGFTGGDSFTYTVGDGNGGTATGTVTVFVTPNNPPIAQDDVETASPAVAFDALANDSDPDQNPIELTGATVPSHGTVSCGHLGGCFYTADAGFIGTDGFDYTIADAGGLEATAHVSIDVTPGSSGSFVIAKSDGLVTTADTPASVDVLANDEGEAPLTIVSTTDPTNGSLSCTPEGLCTYTPAPGFTGFDGFRYTMLDNFGNSATATVDVTIVERGTLQPTVDGIADPPAVDVSEVVQGGTATWSVGAIPDPRGLSSDSPDMPRDLSTSITGPHEIDASSVTAAPGWSSETTPEGLAFHAGDHALLGESETEPLPEPGLPISQGTGGDGHVPILIGSKVFAFFHHSAPTSVTCIDRSTGQRCPGYPIQLNMATNDVPGPGAIIGSRIFVHLRPLQSDAYALFCWDSATDQPCGLSVLERGNSGFGSAPVAIDGKVWAVGGSGQLYCLDPATLDKCDPDGIDTGLFPFSGGVIDVVSHGSLVYVAGGGPIACIDVALATTCTGWAQPRDAGFAVYNVVNRHSATGVADGVCAVNSNSSVCIGDGGGPASTFGGWPFADGFYNVTEEAETGTRTLWGSLGVSGLTCWDWTTMDLCEGGAYQNGQIVLDVDGNALPSAYGAAFDGSCAVALGDPGLVFTVAPEGSSPCASLGTGAEAKVIDLRTQRCDGTVGDASWRDVQVLGVDLVEGAELASLRVDVRDADTDELLASREMVGTGGTLDLSGIDASAHPAVRVEATATSLPGNPAWSDANPPRLRLRWNSDPSFGCFQTTTVKDCALPSPTQIGVTAEIGQAQASDTLTLLSPPECGGLNGAPTADPQSLETDEGDPLPITLTGSDPDGDTLTFAILTGPQHGSLAGAGASRTYTPDAGFSGADGFTFNVSDGEFTSPSATVSITVRHLNGEPVANDDVLSTLQETPGDVDVLANDTDPDPGDLLEVTGSTDGTHGTVSCTAAGICTYSPEAGFAGTDAFTYSIADGHGGADEGSVDVTVEAAPPPNRPPIAADDSIETLEDAAGSVNVLANDTDPDQGDTLEVSAWSSAAHGTVSCVGAGLCTYTPDADFSGTDAFTYTVSDPDGHTDAGSVSVRVTPINDPPTAVADDLTTDEDVVGSVDVLANDTDPENDPLSVSAFVQGTHGSVSCASAGLCTYLPNHDFSGTDSFAYTISDGNGGASTATVHVTVEPLNDSPTLEVTGSPADVQYSDPVTIELSADDPDGDPVSFSASGLPAGITLTDHGDGTATISGDITEGAGSYQATVSVSDGTATVDDQVTVDVHDEDATLAYTGDMIVSTTGTTASVRLAAQVTQQADGHPGDLTKAAVTFELYASSNVQMTSPDMVVGPITSDATGLAQTTISLGVDVWTVVVKIPDTNRYYVAPPIRSAIAVYVPAPGKVTGGGWVPNGSDRSSFGLVVQNKAKRTDVSGNVNYVFTQGGKLYQMRSSGWGGGSLTITPDGRNATIQGKGALTVVGGRSTRTINVDFRVDLVDGRGTGPDAFAITILQGTSVFHQVGALALPITIAGGQVVIHLK